MKSREAIGPHGPITGICIIFFTFFSFSMQTERKERGHISMRMKKMGNWASKRYRGFPRWSHCREGSYPCSPTAPWNTACKMCVHRVWRQPPCASPCTRSSCILFLLRCPLLPLHPHLLLLLIRMRVPLFPLACLFLLIMPSATSSVLPLAPPPPPPLHPHHHHLPELPQILPFAILALLPMPPTAGARPPAHPWLRCASEWSRLGWTSGTEHEWNCSVKTEALSYGLGRPRRGGGSPAPQEILRRSPSAPADRWCTS